MVPLKQVEKQRLVGPFEIEQHPHGITHTVVLPFLTAKVEHKARAAGDVATGDGVHRYVPVLDRGKIISRCPFLGRAGRAERVCASLKRLKRRSLIEESLNPDGVKVEPPLVERMIRAPPVGIFAIHDRAPQIDVADHIRPRAHKRLFVCGFVQPSACAREPFLGKRVPKPDQPHAVTLGCGLRKFKPDLMRAGHFDVLKKTINNGPKLRDALVQKQINREFHILCRHRRAVGKGDVIAQVHHDPIQALGIFDRGAKIAVRAVGIVGRGNHQVFV